MEGQLSMLAPVAAGDDQVLTLKELAQYLEVEMATLDEWAAKRKIPAYQEENTWKFRKSEVDRWIQEEKLKV